MSATDLWSESSSAADLAPGLTHADKDSRQLVKALGQRTPSMRVSAASRVDVDNDDGRPKVNRELLDSLRVRLYAWGGD